MMTTMYHWLRQIETGRATPRVSVSRVKSPLLAALLLAMPLVAAAADPKLLPPEEAFRFSARALDERTIEARFAVADGYYLYRDKMRFAVTPAAAALAAPQLPPGKAKEDQFFGKVETFRDSVAVKLTMTGTGPGQAVVVAAESQGCADQGVCYPPNLQKVTIIMPAAGKGPGPLVDANPPRKRWFN
ncbi:MAG: protein-disulfide reductase DsbD N-terminal domain-containing protein [Casimicrobiaceae bacterium]